MCTAATRCTHVKWCKNACKTFQQHAPHIQQMLFRNFHISLNNCHKQQQNCAEKKYLLNFTFSCNSENTGLCGAFSWKLVTPKCEELRSLSLSLSLLDDAVAGHKKFRLHSLCSVSGSFMAGNCQIQLFNSCA